MKKHKAFGILGTFVKCKSGWKSFWTCHLWLQNDLLKWQLLVSQKYAIKGVFSEIYGKGMGEILNNELIIWTKVRLPRENANIQNSNMFNVFLTPEKLLKRRWFVYYWYFSLFSYINVQLNFQIIFLKPSLRKMWKCLILRRGMKPVLNRSTFWSCFL